MLMKRQWGKEYALAFTHKVRGYWNINTLKFHKRGSLPSLWVKCSWQVTDDWVRTTITKFSDMRVDTITSRREEASYDSLRIFEYQPGIVLPGRMSEVEGKRWEVCGEERVSA